MCLQIDALYQSPNLGVWDVRCRPESRLRGPEEWTETALVAFPRTGVFLKRVNGVEFVADPNQVVFFNAGESYHCAHPVGEGDDCTTYAFPTDVLEEVVGEYAIGGRGRAGYAFDRTHFPLDSPTAWKQHGLRRQVLRPEADGLRVEEDALHLLAAIVRGMYAVSAADDAARSATGVRRRRAEQIRLLLAERYADDLNLEQIGRATGCSAFHAARVFRSETGVTVHHYRNQLRLRHALERLAGREKDLATLARDLGFSSHGHFSDAFRAAFGISPSACRSGADRKWFREKSKILEAGSVGAS